jgi:hypothetical protein
MKSVRAYREDRHQLRGRRGEKEQERDEEQIGELQI